MTVFVRIDKVFRAHEPEDQVNEDAETDGKVKNNVFGPPGWKNVDQDDGQSHAESGGNGSSRNYGADHEGPVEQPSLKNRAVGSKDRD